MTYLPLQLLDALFQRRDPFLQGFHVHARRVAARSSGWHLGLRLFDALRRALDGPAQ
jgi:hypothetical protein